MPETISFNYICNKLEEAKYKVHRTPQEKIPPGELVVTVEDIDLDVEAAGPVSYVATIVLKVETNTTDADSIPRSAMRLTSVLDNIIDQPTFKLGKPTIRILGQAYIVSILCEYMEIVEVGEQI